MKQRQDKYLVKEWKNLLEIERKQKACEVIRKKRIRKWVVSFLQTEMAGQGGSQVAAQIATAFQTVPITMNVGQVNDKPFSIAPFPLFTRSQGLDPDGHLAQCITSCIANNARTEEYWKIMFPTTLRDLAFQWYDRKRHGHFSNWATLKAQFLAQF